MVFRITDGDDGSSSKVWGVRSLARDGDIAASARIASVVLTRAQSSGSSAVLQADIEAAQAVLDAAQTAAVSSTASASRTVQEAQDGFDAARELGAGHCRGGHCRGQGRSW